MKGGNACGRKGSIRDLQPGRQLHRCGADRIHRDRDKLRYVGSAPRHSSDQPKLFLQKAPDRAADHEAEEGVDRGREEWTVEDGVVNTKIIVSVDFYKWSDIIRKN